MTQRVDAARLYLEQNDDREVRLDDLARAAALSKHHLARLFAEFYGAPPARYHRELRLSRAAEQLAAGAMSMARAAERFGFSDAATFCRAFKRAFHAPPGRYLRQRAQSDSSPRPAASTTA